MSSSVPAAPFPALPLSKERDAGDRVHKDQARPSAEPTDEALLIRIRENDEEAVRLLFRRYARLVWRIAERILRDCGEAEDVVQEVFLRIYRKAYVFDPAKGLPRTLIVHMAYQCALTRRTYLATRHFRCNHDAEEDGLKTVRSISSSYDESIEAHFGKEGLRRAFADLSEEQRETLHLYFFEGYTIEEIAPKLRQSKGNVKHYLYRGLDKLRKHLPRADRDD
jgi:RNA polymerase sigma-70 factor (ECF subfamily)